jgi:hypothetical protein
LSYVRYLALSGRILRYRQGTLIRPCRALRALRLNSNVDSVLSKEWRFNDYKSNYKGWEALLIAVGLSMWVGSLDPDLGPQVPAGVAECRIELWQRACGRHPHPGGARGGVRSCLICEPVSGVDTSKLRSMLRQQGGR